MAGDWCEARAAAAATRDAADVALVDPAGGALPETGMLGIIGLLEGPAHDVRPLPPIEWPMPSMELSVNAWYADCLARAGHVDQAVEVLAPDRPDVRCRRRSRRLLAGHVVDAGGRCPSDRRRIDR